MLGKSEKGAAEEFYYFCQNELHGVRRGNWKLLLPNRKKFYGYVDDKGHTVFSYAHPIFWAPFTLIGDGGGKAPGA